MPVDLLISLRMLLAAALGAIIGYQRERVGKEAGLRTHILICTGSALFAVVSAFGFAGADPSRVAAGVVMGIGFLGAGVILHRSGGTVVGLTTAATIWVVAGIGLAVGTGLYIVGVVVTAIVMLALLLPHWPKPNNTL